MHIINLVWHEDNVLHIAMHKVSPLEVEEVCFEGSSRTEKGRGEFYYITGQSKSGRYLFIVVKYIGRGNAVIITARDMDDKEKYRYKRRK